MTNEFYQTMIVPHIGIVVKICRAYSNSQEEYDDLFQEVCLQIWRCRDNFSGASKWSTWIYRLTLNICLTHLRKKPEQGSELDDAIADQSLAVDEKLFKSQAIQTLYAAIRRLPDLDRAILLLYLEENSYQEIAEVIGMNANSIGVRINRIKDKISKMISDKG